MRKVLFSALMILALAPVPSQAQILNSDSMASRMNRDHDYPWDPSDQQYVKMPPVQKIRQYERKMSEYLVYRKQQAKAEWVAMTPDQKRRFIRRHPEAFRPGGILGDF